MKEITVKLRKNTGTVMFPIDEIARVEEDRYKLTISFKRGGLVFVDRDPRLLETLYLALADRARATAELLESKRRNQ